MLETLSIIIRQEHRFTSGDYHNTFGGAQSWLGGPLAPGFVISALQAEEMLKSASHLKGTRPEGSR